ncbi:DUF262 domain-containing protein [Burkholderia plantarii]|uniref:DUF262 domain-containing protein n=1 Tax=Burkholderia plantarii TaxID=41899 RepID=UPI0018DEC45B|nr:DUF262 domain-containing protein [Burkholderia plantarii]MBI0325551.1 DUF262 domain-containing protein [Burkholderia plantarii]
MTTIETVPVKPIKDPQPSVDRIDDLARRILTGDIYLPKFQREFVWERSQVLELLDSVARNYPIGSVLLWQSRQELRSENKIADLEIAQPKPDYPVNYLLDGQQRLSSICGALYWTGEEANSPWNVVYDLRSKTFQHLDTLDQPPPHLMRLNKIPDSAAFFQLVGVLESSGEKLLAENAKELFNRFKDYKVATVTLGDMPLADVAPIFERINSTGTRLTIVDLMRAATWSPDFDLVDAIDDVRESLAAKAFEGVERKVILRNVSAAAGGSFTVESIDDLRKLTSDVLKQAVAATAEGYKRAIDFLSTHIKAPSVGVVPYTNQIVVLSEILRLVPMPTAAQWKAIERWFWRSSISGYFSGWNSGMMAADLTSVSAFAGGNLNALDSELLEPNVAIWRTRSFRGNNSHSKVLALIMAYQRPRDILSGQVIDVDKSLAWQNGKEFHHFFPQAFLKKKGVSSGKISALSNMIYLTSASNRLISDRAPSEYMHRLLDEHGDEAKGWLESNLVDDAAISAALKDDYDGFLIARANAIHREAKTLGGW